MVAENNVVVINDMLPKKFKNKYYTALNHDIYLISKLFFKIKSEATIYTTLGINYEN